MTTKKIQTRPTDWTYFGQPIRAAKRADIAPPLRPGNQYAYLVQKALDTNPTWPANGNPAWSIRLSGEPTFLPKTVAASPLQARIWGLYRGHTDPNAGLCPFVFLEDKQAEELSRSPYITIHIRAMGTKLVLTNAHFGPYVPPLPWMPTHAESDMGKRVNYWHWHAFPNTSWLNNMKESSPTDGNPPSWYRPLP